MSRLLSAVGCLALILTSAFVPACAAPADDGDADAEEGSQDVVSTTLSAATEQSLAKRLPTTPALDAWYTSAVEIERALANGDPRFVLAPHIGGGTSAYVEVKRDGKTIGAFLPDNSATVPLGEVRAFQLARAFGVPDNVGRGVFFRLQGVGLASFKTIMESERYTSSKEENRVRIVAKLATNPASVLGVYKDWSGPRPVEYSSLARGGAPNGKINAGDPIVQLLSSEAPQPTEELVSLPGIPNAQASQLALAKQLSTVLVIDALNGQWDRFSGGNMHVFIEGGVVRFVTLDNGGVTTGGTGLAATYRDLTLNEWVTRYDRGVATKVLSLNALVTGTGGGGSEALGFTDALSLRAALMISSDREWNGFKLGLAAVAAAITNAGDDSFFGAAADAAPAASVSLPAP